jgi:hypothetical protein
MLFSFGGKADVVRRHPCIASSAQQREARRR